jgi:DNA polymerase
MVDKKIRQRGKVVELACGFGGSTNALLSMAASYRMHLEEADARATVRRWRDENAWAVRFWGRHENNDSHGVWGALNQAIENPGTFYPAGRVGYIYMAGYLGGSLLCRLPSGRWLTYRRIKWEQVKQVDEDGKETGWERELRFSRDHGRLKIWPGLAVENIVQATAADILRGTLLRLEDPCFDWMQTRLHTHDEVLVEVGEDAHRDAALALRKVMEEGWDWSEGLPIKADTVVARWYTKNEGSMGL